MNRPSTWSVVSWLVILLLLTPFILYKAPVLVGADQSFTVMSGSMEPRLGVGSVIFVAGVSPENIRTQDIITFTKDNAGDAVRYTTHRVVATDRESGTYRFKTKGDANENIDPGWVAESDVVGRTVLTIPYLGYAIQYAGTFYGYLLLVAVPALLLLSNELGTMYNELRRR